MHPDLSKAYDLLGVKPGVSNRELKAAHRDLAKVWHPDRFLHDPRLQEKAQEKLKEINEAYELLISGKVPKAAPPRSVETVYTEHPMTRRRASGSQWTAVPLLIFIAVFAITITVQQYTGTFELFPDIAIKFFAVLATNSSVWHIVVMSIDRYIAIMFPFQ